jgi:lipopolysaccharide transport system ATP-binding protein
MSNTAIKVENLSKRYRIGLKKEIHDTMVGAVTDFIKRPIKNLKRLRKLSTFSKNGNESEDIIWALKDVSFEVKQGEVVGIIGRNGAGKSTLLKIISHITEPTSGSVTFNGRVSSLLEVGTGFHPELTGRENVYLNGTILGMSKSEIDSKFDEIVAFSEVKKFLDTPVKRYSSGMRVRLAFAVAAHLEPEILLVDEVLAVGDAEFQKKCLGKMDNIAGEGRTVLFVSHQIPSIQVLCNRVIFLDNGTIVKDGQPDEVIGTYLHANSNIKNGIIDLSNYTERSSGTEIAIKEAWIENKKGDFCNHFKMGDSLTVCYRFEASRPIQNPGFGFGVEDIYGRRLFSANNYVMVENSTHFESLQKGIIHCNFSSIPLNPGTYYVSISIVENQKLIIDYIERILMFEIEAVDVFKSGKVFDSSQGIFFLPAKLIVKE